MDVNAGLIGLQVQGLLRSAPDVFADDAHKAFVALCMRHLLGLSKEELPDALTDGGTETGVDGCFFSGVRNGAFSIVLFACAFNAEDCDGEAVFPSAVVAKTCRTAERFLNPSDHFRHDEPLAAQASEVQSLILDACLPEVTVVCCNNGSKWNDAAEETIRRMHEKYRDQVSFVHFNHDDLINIQRRVKPITSELHLSGPLIVEDQERLRVMVGRVHVTQIASLYERYGDLLLQRNIRCYLGLKENRVNRAIYDTLRFGKADKFYFYNNGLTIICDRLDYNSWQEKDHIVRLTNMQVINGGQTCRTIYEALKENGSGAVPNASVMVRIYQVPAGMDEFVQDITYSTNSQNPVDLRDLHSNDTLQKDLEIGLAGLGWQYKRQRDDRPAGGQVLTSAVVAEAVLSVWREQPHHARFLRRELFGRLYETIFSGLTAAQALVAALIFRDVEARRRSGKDLPLFVPYASQYLSMLVGRQLLSDTCGQVKRLTHRNVEDVLARFETDKDDYYRKATEQIAAMLRKEYPEKEPSLQQLSAVFRRGELLGLLG